MNKIKKLFNTKVIHAGHKEDKETGSVIKASFEDEMRRSIENLPVSYTHLRAHET